MEDLRCTKAIIAVAGFGTRRLPLTKAIEKCMIPVGNRPIIDYVVDDCIKAGITDIYLIVGEDASQIRRYYGHNPALEAHLEAKGKTDALRGVQDLSTKARFHFIVQDNQQPYGTSIPIDLCKEFIDPGERFVVVFGDQFFYHADGGSELAYFMQRAATCNTSSMMLGVTVPHEQTVNYGVIAYKQVGDQCLYEHIVERPATPDEAPSDLNNASFFIFESGVLPFIHANATADIAGEHFLIDALNAYVAAGNSIAVLEAKGEYLDCGTVQGWLHANNRVLGTEDHV